MYDASKYKCYTYDEKNEDGSYRCGVIVAISTYAGKTVKGYAKLHPDDNWDWEKGRDLAIARCNAKIAKKRKNRANSKVAEARKQVVEAMKFLEDMLTYQSDAVEELGEANEHLCKVINGM